MTPSADDDRILKFEFTLNEVRLLFKALGCMPYEQIEALNAKLQEQTAEQLRIKYDDISSEGEG